MKMNLKTIEYLRRRTAELAIGNSTLRNQGASGVVKAARDFLAELALNSFSVNSQKDFGRELDQATESLIPVLPDGAHNWGTARKAINIFLRDCLYNQFLCNHYAISQIHPWLEVPLDKYVAEGLQDTSMGDGLPEWETIKGLDRKTSDQYQHVANDVAGKLGCNRVDLDIYFWRGIGAADCESI